MKLLRCGDCRRQVGKCEVGVVVSVDNQNHRDWVVSVDNRNHRDIGVEVLDAPGGASTGHDHSTRGGDLQFTGFTVSSFY